MAKEIYSSPMKTPVGLAFYSSLSTPRVWDGKTDEGKYEVSIAWPASDKEKLAEIGKRQAQMATEAFGSKGAKTLALNLVQTETGDFYTMKLKTKTAPGVILYDKTPLTGADIRDGNMIRASFSLAVGEFSGNRYVKACLNNVQKISEGSGIPEGLGVTSRPSAESEFDVVESDKTCSDDSKW